MLGGFRGQAQPFGQTDPVKDGLQTMQSHGLQSGQPQLKQQANGFMAGPAAMAQRNSASQLWDSIRQTFGVGSNVVAPMAGNGNITNQRKTSGQGLAPTWQHGVASLGTSPVPDLHAAPVVTTAPLSGEPGSALSLPLTASTPFSLHPGLAVMAPETTLPLGSVGLPVDYAPSVAVATQSSPVVGPPGQLDPSNVAPNYVQVFDADWARHSSGNMSIDSDDQQQKAVPTSSDLQIAQLQHAQQPQQLDLQQQQQQQQLVAYTVGPTGVPVTFHASQILASSPMQQQAQQTLHLPIYYSPANSSLGAQLLPYASAAGYPGQVFPTPHTSYHYPYSNLHYAAQPSLGHMPAVLPIVVPQGQPMTPQDAALVQHFLAQPMGNSGSLPAVYGFQGTAMRSLPTGQQNEYLQQLQAQAQQVQQFQAQAQAQAQMQGNSSMQLAVTQGASAAAPAAPSSQMIDAALQNAHARYNSGDYRSALAILQQLRIYAPRKLSVLLLLGCTCYSLGLHHLSILHNEEILTIDPSFAEAYSNLGTTFRALAQANPQALAPIAPFLASRLPPNASHSDLTKAAEGYYRQALALRPRYWDAAVNLAGLLSSRGRYAEAVQVYGDLETALEKAADQSERMARREVLGAGDLADRSYVLALHDAEKRRQERVANKAAAVSPTSHHHHHRHHRGKDSKSSWDNTDTRRDLYYAKGNLHYVLGDITAAKKEYLKALVVSNVDVIRVMNSCHPGVLPPASVTPQQVLQLAAQNKKDGNGANMGKQAQQQAGTSLMLQTLAKIYQDSGMAHFAVAFYYMSLSLHPVANSCNNIGILLSTQRMDEAIAWYEVGLQLDPNHPHVLTNLGSALKDRGMVQQGITCYKRAISIQPDFYIALANLANVYKDQGKVDEAIQLYRRALTCKPDFTEAFCNYVNSLLFVCDWTDRTENLGKIAQVVGEQLKGARKTTPVSVPTVLPFHTFTYASLSAFQVREISRLNAERILCNVVSSAWFSGFPQRPAKIAASALAALPVASTSAEAWAAFSGELKRAVESALCYPLPRPPPPLPDPRIAVGYVSSDFKDHPLSHLMQSVFGLHDRSRFRIVCYALCPPDESGYSRKIAGECEKFVDASQMSIQEIVDTIGRDGIHILVNLNGYTKGGRNEIFAARPAPLAVQFMGYAGTMGAGPVLDEVAPPGMELHSGQNDLSAVDSDPDLAFFDTLQDRWIDYFIADEIALPRRTVIGEPRDIEFEQVLQGKQPAPEPSIKRRKATDTNRVYTENVVYLPHSYFVNDHKQGFRDLADEEADKLTASIERAATVRPATAPDGEGHLSAEQWKAWTREQFLRLKMRQDLFPGIREDTVIYANMNQSYKIDPQIFETWLNILRRVPNSILWLLRFPPAAEKHLKRWAVAKAGEDVAKRVIFTDVAPKHIHIHRGRIADVFLDTPECNAHTTAADILWSGTPLVTLPKYEFKMCSRVAASVAYATGSWDAADVPDMMRELSGAGPEVPVEMVEQRATAIARQKAKSVTGTGDLEWWVRSRSARQLREGQVSRAERLQDPKLLGHFMVATNYKEYEDRAVQLGLGTGWEWKDIAGVGSAGEALAQAFATQREANVPFYPSRQAPTHILTPTGPLVRLRRTLFLTRDKIPLFDTARWVRDIEKSLALCWERWLESWEKIRERNLREFADLAQAGLDMNEVAMRAAAHKRGDLNKSPQPALRSRCLWIEDEDIQKSGHGRL